MALTKTAELDIPSGGGSGTSTEFDLMYSVPGGSPQPLDEGDIAKVYVRGGMAYLHCKLTYSTPIQPEKAAQTALYIPQKQYAPAYGSGYIGSFTMKSDSEVAGRIMVLSENTQYINIQLMTTETNVRTIEFTCCWPIAVN